MMRMLLLMFFIVILSQNTFGQEDSANTFISIDDCECMESISQSSDLYTGGLKILQVGREIAVVNKEIITGSCWDFVNHVYKKSGTEKQSIFKSKKSGPYASPEMVKPGDWIYHINYSYKNIEHSAIFVCWKDVAKRIAITLSYAGGNRKLPGKYGTYNLSGIYSIMRPTETPNQTL